VAGFCVSVLSTFLGLTGGRAGGYGLIGACIDAGDEVDEVAGRENENGVRLSVDWAYLRSSFPVLLYVPKMSLHVWT
jgi:hypothetical protein